VILFNLVLMVGVSGAVVLLARGMRERFVHRVKTGDVIGVDFGEEIVLNRTVICMYPDGGYGVKSKNMTNVLSIPQKRIYLPDTASPIDKPHVEA
jgi:hypothetical protein